MPALSDLRLGLVGLDTSHVVTLAETFNSPTAAHPVAGARVVAAWPGGSPDLPISASRVAGFTQRLRDEFGVSICGTPEVVAELCDAVVITSVDGRVHRAQYDRIARFGKPVFIDKPIALSRSEAEGIFAGAAALGGRVFSCSALRFTEALTAAVSPARRDAVTGADFAGPLLLDAAAPGFFWYGIHAAEMLYAALGRGCRSLRVERTGDHEVVVARWADGRLGTIRGHRTGNHGFHGLVHFPDHSDHIDVAAAATPYFTSLARELVTFFRGGPPPVDAATTLELVRFLEAANESRDHGGREVIL